MCYTNSFIQVAPDCPATTGEIPVARGETKSVPVIQYELLSQHPYRFTQDELIFEVHVRHKRIPKSEVSRRRDELWKELFQKPHPCLRASMLPKRYGWGVHYDHKGRIALVATDSQEYAQFADGKCGGPKLLLAMRNKRP